MINQASALAQRPHIVIATPGRLADILADPLNNVFSRVKILVLDEPTEGIQPSIIKDIGNAIRHLRKTSGMSFLLVEQYLDFCRDLADKVYIMDRGEVVHAGPAEDLDKTEVRRHLMV